MAFLSPDSMDLTASDFILLLRMLESPARKIAGPCGSENRTGNGEQSLGRPLKRLKRWSYISGSRTCAYYAQGLVGQ